jgi:hypothetical protein
MLCGFCQSLRRKIEGLQVKLKRKEWNAALSLYLNVFVRTYLDGWMHTQTPILFNFVYIAYVGLPHVGYCNETRNTKSAMGERVNKTNFVQRLS